jgi:hypothetical protein
MKVALPSKRLPTGHPNPFERQIEMLSNHAPRSLVVYWPLATMALNTRAPSR